MKWYAPPLFVPLIIGNDLGKHYPDDYGKFWHILNASNT